MTTKAHSTLTGADLHENKGASSATDDFVATVTSGATVWKKLTASNLTGTGNPFGAQLLHVREVQSSGVNTTLGTLTANTWTTVPLNSVLTNEISASLSSNQISLAAGTYFLDGWAVTPNGADQVLRARLFNVTDNTEAVSGQNVSVDASATPTYIPIRGRFTLSGTKTMELQVISKTTATINATYYLSQGSEQYSDLLIWKVS